MRSAPDPVPRASSKRVGFSCGKGTFTTPCAVLRGYVPAFPGAMRALRDTETGVRIEVVVTGEYPGDGKPKSVAFPDPATVAIHADEFRVVPLETLINLKLASGLSAPHRLRDLADVQDLIARAGLSLELADKLDPSVRDEYRRLWETMRGASGDRD